MIGDRARQDGQDADCAGAIGRNPRLILGIPRPPASQAERRARDVALGGRRPSRGIWRPDREHDAAPAERSDTVLQFPLRVSAQTVLSLVMASVAPLAAGAN